MSRDERLQALCRGYLRKLRHTARKYGLGGFIDDIVKANRRNECEGTRKEVEMLASMDAKAIADHQAEIDERAYWRKLRGDIALAIISQKSEKLSLRPEDEWVLIAYKTDQFFNMLYNQDKEFKI